MYVVDVTGIMYFVIAKDVVVTLVIGIVRFSAGHGHVQCRCGVMVISVYE